MSKKCTECKNLTPLSLKCQNSDEKLKVYQFELRHYIRKETKKGKLKDKISKETEKVEKQMTYPELLNFVDIKNHTLFTNMKFLMIYTTDHQRFSKLTNYN